jgi:hypothetical protein
MDKLSKEEIAEVGGGYVAEPSIAGFAAYLVCGFQIYDSNGSFYSF